jgi:hypothetical protein
MLPPLPPNVVSLRSVEIALAKFDIKVPIEDIVSAIVATTFSFPLNPSNHPL